MPELPDIELYIDRLTERIDNTTLDSLSINNLFVLRTVSPKPADLNGLKVVRLFRVGKRICIELEGSLFVLIHLMISGRFIWSDKNERQGGGGRALLAKFVFGTGTLSLIESSTRKRASIHLFSSLDQVLLQSRGGLDLFTCTQEQFAHAVGSRNRTLKRFLTDPSAIDGVGNAYSDEILFAAKLSPLKLTSALNPEETKRLLEASTDLLQKSKEFLKHKYVNFPKPSDVTAFRPEFAVHGKYGSPCPECGSPIQRIVYAENETNYCAICQNEGRLLADRALSRLLKSDWPKTLEEMIEGG